MTELRLLEIEAKLEALREEMERLRAQVAALERALPRPRRPRRERT